ncbi:hypothetical protein DNK06_07055 [Pseudomonas daroniae]|uniref:Glycine zipper family protein n=1 Tax=Phytopseudomonas daroniae TaxID=2487519 RepID=A0A4Q9QNH0_9GAMM|nr:MULTISPECIES: hypothetical protein [Pseudomonas]TBU81530.1 hypothetical protein DNK06_07055 [Pseudomonas daroniae]TBU84306.1 hypothetical protein DNK31_08120 [Pseudomonas sp. FRB 228]TBU89901.1 hypothetical protein DNJ99_15230 [Pseudomonas daroniae]
MKASLPCTAVVALLLTTLSLNALAGPGGPGGSPGGHGGHGGPGPGWGGSGPRHGHGLPNHARELWIGSALYFVAAGTYYMWNADRRQYIVVEAPPVISSAPAANYDVIAYPARGQNADLQARDRYECHSWAVSQSGFDPATATSAPAASATDYYRRALGACLSGRGYSIN